MPGVKRDTMIRGVTPKELYDVVVDYAAQQASSQVRARSPFRCWS